MKLNKFEKALLKTYKLSTEGEFIYMGRVIAFVAKTGSNRGFISWAVCSPEEKKFNEKRGQLMAIERFARGIKLPIENFNEFELEMALVNLIQV